MGFNFKSFLGGAGGGALASMIPGLKQFSPAISAGAGALLNKDNRLGGALQGFAGGGVGQSLGSGLSQGIGGLTQPGGTFGKALSGFGTGLQSGAKNYMNAIPGMGGTFSGEGVTGGNQGMLAKLFGNMSGMGNSRSTGSTPTGNNPFSISNAQLPGPQSSANQISSAGGLGAPAAASFGTPSVNVQAPSKLVGSPSTPKSDLSFWDKLMPSGDGGNNIGKALAGGAVAGIGDMFAPKVEAPNLAAFGQSLQEQMRAGELGDPIAKELGMEELRRVLGQGMGEVPENAFTLGDTSNEKRKQDAITALTQRFKGAQPGVDVLNNPQYQAELQKIEKMYDDERVMQRDQQQYQYLQQQLQQKYNYMVQALGMDERQMQQYLQLSQLGVDQLMLEYGLSVGEAQQFKQLFSDLGQTIAGGGQNQGININLNSNTEEAS